MITLDTSALIDCLTGEGRSYPRLANLLLREPQVTISALALFEWKRGPRLPKEIGSQESLFPSASALPFGPAEAEIAAGIYRRLKRARGREMDIAIAATAIANGAELWSLNPRDFADIPGLKLAKP
jgi:predicted nucleic acid-binding protein